MKYNRSVKIKSAALLIVFISIMGWIYECAFYSLTEGEFIRRGFCLGPWIPIYGVGTALFLLVTGMKEITAFKAFVAGFLGSGILEFVTGWGLYHFADGLRLWDYNTEIWNWGNIGGFVCLRSVLIFGCLGLLVNNIIVPLVINKTREMKKWILTAMTLPLFTLFVLDFIYGYLIKPILKIM